jgi:lipoyl synthase
MIGKGRRLPPWFTQKIPEPKALNRMERLLKEKSLHTVCEGALCPNMGQCFSRGTATFMILGDTCTRRCTFCAVNKGLPAPVDEAEPQHILEAVGVLGLQYVVITSVTRDDLIDGGASQFAQTIRVLREGAPGVMVEVLIPDFGGSMAALEHVVSACPEVINHNIETVPGLYPRVRPQAEYTRSLSLLAAVKMLDSGITTKSGLMVGLTETKDELVGVMADLLDHGCDLLTIGQYLQPSVSHHPVMEFISPGQFAEYERIGLDMGFKGVTSAPLVRSSFRAADLFLHARAVRKTG